MTLLLLAIASLVAGALGAILFARSARVLSTLSTLGAVMGSALGLWCAGDALGGQEPSSLAVGWLIPHGGLSVGLDPLSAFFLVPLFVLGGLGAIYGRSYLLAFSAKRSLALPFAAFNVLVASMALVVVARNAVLFLVAWETMSLAAYLLITFEHEQALVRRAGFVYLVATHLGMAFLIGLFLLLGHGAGSFEFDAIQAAGVPSASLASLLFVLGLVGFGTKAGLFPLHVWLPEAHAASPSHVSALMSGVLIKMGIYGLLRVVLLIGGAQPWWGPLLMCLGLCGAALGIAMAVYQRDLKRVLAYSSVENVGLIALGMGLGLWGAASGRPLVATLGLGSALLHVWNHTLMKGIMFLGAGSILHACHSRDLEELGGLGRRMPQTAALLIVGATAIAGLPPLNGFVSEWLLYSGLLSGALELEGAGGVAMLAAVAAVSLIGAMAALCFIRVVGIALLGEPRSPGARHAREASPWMTVPIAVLALGALAVAFMPQFAIAPVERVVAELLGSKAAHAATSELGLSRLGAFNVALAAVLVLGTALVVTRQRSGSPLSDRTWACGYAAESPRMQYTARAVSELFASTMLPRPAAPHISLQGPEGPFPQPSRLLSETTDPLTRAVYEPFVTRWATRFARLRFLQQGLLHVYIVYILVALLAALAWSAAQPLWFSS